MADVYFNARKIKPNQIKNEYVAFVDIMGTRDFMVHKDIHEAANYIFKLHAAIISAINERRYNGVFVYPVMDGAYITSTRKDDMQNILSRVYREMANIFINSAPEYRFLIRCGLAYGEVIHGHRIPYEASNVFELDLSYKSNLLLGKPMILAFAGEGKAAPFGIFIDDSALRHGQKGFGAMNPDWKWHVPAKGKGLKIALSVPGALIPAIRDYLNAWENRTSPDELDKRNPSQTMREKINGYRRLAEQYFS